jgi:uncharacterized protein (TIGR00296 family)
MLSQSDGDFLVKLARKAIKAYVQNRDVINPPKAPEYMNEKMGVFVTIHKNSDLRGCIGYPEPIKPLITALIEVAIGAATEDPRFPPVKLQELDEIQLEVSVLTKPEIIIVEKPADYINKIIIGEDGLIMERGMFRGLLLPQVPVEWGWDVEEFLANTCMKAGMSPDCWLHEDIKIYAFKSQIFEEKK